MCNTSTIATRIINKFNDYVLNCKREYMELGHISFSSCVLGKKIPKGYLTPRKDNFDVSQWLNQKINRDMNFASVSDDSCNI